MTFGLLWAFKIGQPADCAGSSIWLSDGFHDFWSAAEPVRACVTLVRLNPFTIATIYPTQQFQMRGSLCAYLHKSSGSYQAL